MGSVVSEFINYLAEYFRGPTRVAEYRELFLCRGDPKGDGFRDRGGVWIHGLDTYLSTIVKRIREWNVYMGVGYWTDPSMLEPELDKMLYDRLSFDFDSEEDAEKAVSAAISFSNILNNKHGITPLVFRSGFKGAHVVVPLAKPIDWESYQLLWRHFYELIPSVTRKMVDLSMLQWNRVDRVPLTYNVKEEGSRFCTTIYPRGFTWRDFSWGELQLLDPSSVTVVKVVAPDVVRPKRLPGPAERKWIWEVVKRGLPDGRHRFMLMVLIPYLSVVKQLPEEEVLSICHEFLENSCRNHGNCGKVYDSWIRSAIGSTKKREFRGFGLEKFKEKNPDIRGLLEKMLGE